MCLKSLKEVEQALANKNPEVILSTLKDIKAHHAEALAKQLCRLAYHFDYRIRAASYLALSKARTINIADIINDGLKDSRKEVFRSAADLYHKKAA